jgi:Tfp pilus assembly protein PilF
MSDLTSPLAADSSAFGSDTLQAMAQLAARYYRNGMPAQAAQVYAFLVRHDPTQARHYLSLGKAEHAQGLHEQALQSYSRAVRLGLADADVHLYIGQCLILLGRMAQAEQALQACLRLAAVSQADVAPFKIRAQQMLVRVQKHLARTSTGQNAA